MKHYNVIIVGAGPAGATAAYVLKTKYNVNVLLCDRHNFPREKICAGLLPAKTTDLVNEIFNEPVKNVLSVTNKLKIFYKEDFITETETTIPFSVINRYDFDNQLLANYLNANGEYRFKCTLKQVNVTEKTVTFFNGETFSYDYIIGADGAFSMMRQYVDKRFNKIFFFNLYSVFATVCSSTS